MFSFEKCLYQDCDIYRVTGDEKYCLHHSPKKVEITQNVSNLFQSPNQDIRDLAINGASFSDLEVSEKKIIGSTLAFTVFENCRFKKVHIINSFFDFALFQNCIFEDCSIRYCSFSGASFNLSTIHDSTVIHDNFNGVNILGSDFSENDFYYSSFIMSKLIQVKLEDCNLKRTDFSSSIIQAISFKYSNLDEAQFRKEPEYTI